MSESAFNLKATSELEQLFLANRLRTLKWNILRASHHYHHHPTLFPHPHLNRLVVKKKYKKKCEAYSDSAFVYKCIGLCYHYLPCV